MTPGTNKTAATRNQRMLVSCIEKKGPSYEYRGLAKARLVVSHIDGNDAMRLLCENVAGLNVESVAESIREITKLRGDVLAVNPGTLPNDGKVIEDIRSYA